jgi:ADP-ribose pyrophosphatase
MGMEAVGVSNMQDKARPSSVEVKHKERVLDKFFKVDEVTVSHELFAGGMSKDKKVLVFERGDAVAALLYDPERRKVITVDQFRLPTYEKGGGSGWLVEAVAGMIPRDKNGNPTEAPVDCLRHEVLEETGYRLTTVIPICTFFSSPGGTSERIFLYFGEVRQTAKVASGGGERDEDIDVVEYDVDDFFRRLADQQFEDPKLIIAGFWFKSRRGAIQLGQYDLEIGRTYEFRETSGPGRIIGIKTGDIQNIKSVPVWVNSANVFMTMDPFFGRSISSTIRYLGAKKSGAVVEEDTIGRAILDKLGKRSVVQPGTVISSTPGELERTHNVEQIFHVATVIQANGEFTTTAQVLELSIKNVLDKISAAKLYKSALIPLLGTGTGGLPADNVAPRLAGAAVEFFRNNPRSALKKIYFLAYTAEDFEIIKTAIEHKKFGVFNGEYDEPQA